MTNRSICFSLASCLLLAATLSLGAGPIPLSGFELGPAKGNQSSATISAGANGFLVAWRDTRVASNGEIRITRLDANGAVTNPAGILISASDSTQYGGTTQPSVAWTGERWLVAFATASGLSIVAVSADGNLLGTPHLIASGNLTPGYRHSLLAVGERVFVTGISAGGATFMILSALGDVLAPPRVVESHSNARPITAIHAANVNGEVLLLDESAYPCNTCPAFVAHRFRLDGVEISRTPVTDPAKNHFGYSRLGTLRDGYVVVGWKQNGSVEYLMLSDGAASVSSSGT
ncbi:MAG: hypothetical protein NDJ92_09165, partial [Thermoanaerobaculia bacterium]|nr:hypothetical protein [Thermoanaerobaculia bacterium]